MRATAPTPPPARIVANDSPRTKSIAKDGRRDNITFSEQWQPPSVRPEAVALKAALKKLEDQLYETKSWTTEHERQVEGAIERSRTYLDSVKTQAKSDVDTLKLVREKLERKYVGAAQSSQRLR